MPTDNAAAMRVVVLASGNGSNLQALLDAERIGSLGSATVVAVVSDRPTAHVLARARRAGVATTVTTTEPGQTRREYDSRLADEVSTFEPHLIVLAGWMRLLTTAFLERFAHRVINIHPALPNQYPGIHAIERALQDAQAGRIHHTGVMVHFVPDEGVDSGPVIATETVPIDPADTVESLTERVHAVEHRLLPSTVAALSADMAFRQQAAAPPTHAPPTQ